MIRIAKVLEDEATENGKVSTDTVLSISKYFLSVSHYFKQLKQEIIRTCFICGAFIKKIRYNIPMSKTAFQCQERLKTDLASGSR